MTLVTETAPTEEPLTLAEAKAQLRVDHGADDALILALVRAARELVEARTGRRLVSTGVVCYLDRFPCARGGLIELPGGTVSAIASVKYRDPDGILQTLAPAGYQTDTNSIPARMLPAYGTSWPDTRELPAAVEIHYTAGYGGAAAVPETLKSAMRLLIGHLYENREAVSSGTHGNELPLGVEALIATERVYWL